MIVAARLWILALCFSIGIFAGSHLLIPWFWPLAGILGLVLLLLAWASHRRAPESGFSSLTWSTALLLVLGAALVGAASSSVRMVALHSSPLALADGPAELQGIVRTDPVRTHRSVRWAIDVKRLDGNPTEGRVNLSGDLSSARLEIGDRIRVGAVLTPLDASDPEDRRNMYRSITARGSTFTPVIIETRSRSPLLRVADHVRSEMKQMAVAALGNGRAGLLLGITIGDESLIPASSMSAFRASGLSHLTAVSGANVAMVLASVLWLLQGAGVSRWGRGVAALGVLLLFSLITRWEPSVLRASVVAALSVSAFFAGRRAAAVNSLALAYLILLAIDPLLLWSIAFQLSFAATAGILAMAASLSQLMVGRMPSLVANAASVTISAQIAVTPLLIWHFEEVSTLSLPANILAFPLVAPATLFGFIGAGLGTIWEPAGQGILWLSGPLLGALDFIAHLFGTLEFSTVAVDDGVEVLRLALIYCIGICTLLWLKGHRRMFQVGLVTCISGWMFSFVAPVAGHPLPAGMRITFFDVGQGDSALVETIGGARVLVDGGPSDSGVATDLRRAGIKRLDLVVASHGHADHVDGLKDVVQKIAVSMIWYPGVIEGIPSELRHRGMSAPAAGTVAKIADLRVEVLAPSPEIVESAGGDDAMEASSNEGTEINDASLVLKVTFGSACVLFTGDIEEGGQAELLDAHDDSLRCGVLKAPHHGSARLDEDFVEIVDPEVVSVSVGQNDYGHPTKTALDLFRRAGARVFRTDVVGDTVIEMDRRGRWAAAR